MTTLLPLPRIRAGNPAQEPVVIQSLGDAYGRVATDLRVSLTDRCNLRCQYCMPAEGLDWLPRDEAVVDAYVADPWCGEIATTSLWLDFGPAIGKVNDPAALASVRSDLPILLLAGDQDPVGEGVKGIRQAREGYAAAGVADVTATVYPGARHEVFNETNREEVVSDLVAWLDAHLPG